LNRKTRNDSTGDGRTDYGVVKRIGGVQQRDPVKGIGEDFGHGWSIPFGAPCK
jgi:hypothetical protein